MFKQCNTPKIIVKKDIKYEIDLFLNFLNHPQNPQFRYGILKSYPELDALLRQSKKNEREIISKFIRTYYKINSESIEEIVKSSKIDIQKNSANVLNTLANLMDHKWKKATMYTAIATILPFSPFNRPIFSFSIFGQLRKLKEGKTILYIATHEMSHFLFFDALKQAERKTMFKINDDTRHYLKEALAPVIMNQPLLKDLLGLENYRGNPELWELRVSTDGQEFDLVTYLTSAYCTSRTKNEKFNNFLLGIIKAFRSSMKAFTQKRAIWNKYGNSLGKNSEAMVQYRLPIKIKSGGK